MIRGIDHLVIVCADPDAAATELEASLGLRAPAVGGMPAWEPSTASPGWLTARTSSSSASTMPRPRHASRRRGGTGVSASSGAGLAAYALLDDELE